jgi:hypothetical protein
MIQKIFRDDLENALRSFRREFIPGIYFYRLQTGNEMKVGKLLKEYIV